MDPGYILIAIFTRYIISWLLWPIIWWRSQKKIIVLPPINEPLLFLSATNIANKIRNRSVSSEKVIEAYIRRIKQVNPILNAVVEDRFEDALEDARKVDKYLSNTLLTKAELEGSKPLLGIPVTIKESCALKDLSFAVGCLPKAGKKATNDGVAVRRLRNAGAIPLLVSNTPELCLSFESDNFITGRTCNPYDTNRSSGGSSGGEGALLGAGASLTGIGSDLAGSVRVPAMFNGVFGHKTTPGLVSLDGHYPNSSDKRSAIYLTLGPLTRYAEDLKLMMTVLCGSMSTEIRLHQKVDISGLTIYHMKELPGHPFMIPVQQEINNAMEDVLNHLTHICRCNTSNFKFPGLSEAFGMSVSQFLSIEELPNILISDDDPEQEDNLYVESLKSIFGASKYYRDSLLFYLLRRTKVMTGKKQYNKYSRARERLRDAFINKLNTTGVFLFPTCPFSAYRHGESVQKLVGMTYSLVFNVLGFPSTQVPVGFDKNGMPIGLQVIAAPNQDRLGIAVAIELEKRFGGWKPPS